MSYFKKHTIFLTMCCIVIACSSKSCHTLDEQEVDKTKYGENIATAVCIGLPMLAVYLSYYYLKENRPSISKKSNA